MAEENKEINLEGTQWIANIPGAMHDAIAQTMALNGITDASKFLGKITLVGDTSLDLVVNIKNDPDNPGKVIASTVAANGIVYTISGATVKFVASRALIGTALAAAGIASAPITFAVTVLGGI